LKRTEAEIENPEFEPHAGQVGVEQQHAFQRTDGAFEIAPAHGELGEAEGFVKVAGVLEERLEGLIVGFGEPGVVCVHLLSARRGQLGGDEDDEK